MHWVKPFPLNKTGQILRDLTRFPIDGKKIIQGEFIVHTPDDSPDPGHAHARLVTASI
ncbi:MAG: hypothetical protein HC880_21930 [Bacteroidia bacterium]|nr:hypothetical protein [Bacteroidia bacterium]